MAKKKSQKKIGGNYQGSRVKKDESFGKDRRKTYMILSTAAIIVGLLLTVWQQLGNAKSDMELAYSDVTTCIHKMGEANTSYAAALSEGGVSGETAEALTDACATLAEAADASGRQAAGASYKDALTAAGDAADAAKLSGAAYEKARQEADAAWDAFAASCAAYNGKAEAYNAAVTHFPTKLLAALMRYGTAGYIKV